MLSACHTIEGSVATARLLPARPSKTLCATARRIIEEQARAVAANDWLRVRELGTQLGDMGRAA